MSAKLFFWIAGVSLVTGGCSRPAAHADVAQVPHEEVCTAYSKYAQRIMEGRQQGALMSELLSNIESIEAFSDASNAKDKIKELVAMAFETHRYSYPDLQQAAVIDFENDAFLRCMKK